MPSPEYSNDLSLRIRKIVEILRNATKEMPRPLVSTISKKYGKDPFLILISCLMSLRTRDTVTLPVCYDLFEISKTPQEILKVPISKLEKIIYPIGFYKRKSLLLHSVSDEIIKRFNNKVPNKFDDLISIKGVGRKTANLVLGVAFDIPAICVDTHVHRISNRLGLIKTNNVLDTELELQKILPKQYWIEWNKLMVIWGQNICVPISPFNSKCAIFHLCPKIGVKNAR